MDAWASYDTDGGQERGFIKEFVDQLEELGITLRLTAGQAHWQQGAVERQGEWYRSIWDKTVAHSTEEGGDRLCTGFGGCGEEQPTTGARLLSGPVALWIRAKDWRCYVGREREALIAGHASFTRRGLVEETNHPTVGQRGLLEVTG